MALIIFIVIVIVIAFLIFFGSEHKPNEIRNFGNNEQKVESIEMTTTNGYFVFKSISNEKINPSQFGYFALNSSHDMVRESITDLIKKDFNGCSRYFGSYLARFQFLAIYSASYCAYVVCYLGVPASCAVEMQTVMKNLLKGYRGKDYGGDKISDDNIKFFDGLFNRAYKAISDDISNQPESGVVNLGVSNISESYIEEVQHYLLKDGNMPVTDKLYLSQIIAELPIAVFQTLQSQNLTYYH
jgi:hypothetical protein